MMNGQTGQDDWMGWDDEQDEITMGLAEMMGQAEMLMEWLR